MNAFVKLVSLFVLYAMVGLVIGYPIKWCWNYTLPELSKGMIAEITFWQSLALFFLTQLIVKSNVTMTFDK